MTINHFDLPLVTLKPAWRQVMPTALSGEGTVFGWLPPEVTGLPTGMLVLDPDTGVSTSGFWPRDQLPTTATIPSSLPDRARFFRIGPEKVEPYGDPEPTPTFDWAARVDQLEQEVRGLTVARTTLSEVVAERERTIEGLRADLERSIQRTAAAKREHQQDIDTISERLAEEAQERDWTCGEVERVVDDVNQSLHIGLTTPEREVDVDVSGYVRVPFTTTVTIRARIVGDTLDDAALAEVERLLPKPGVLLDNDIDRDDADIEDDWEVSVE